MALFDNCKAAWKLSDLTDATGRGNTLTNNNSVTFVTGKIGNCANYVSASSQYLSLNSNADVNPGDIDFTFGLWFNPSSSGAPMALFSKMDGATAATYNLTWNPGGNTLTFSIFNDSFSTAGAASVSPSFSTGTWYCITAKVDAVNDLIKLRVNDGSFFDSQSTTSAMTSLGSVRLTIGAKDDPGDRQYTDGKIDAVHLWHKALTSGEETEFYNSGTGIEFSGGAGVTYMPYYGGGYSPYRRIIRVNSY